MTTSVNAAARATDRPSRVRCRATRSNARGGTENHPGVPPGCRSDDTIATRARTGPPPGENVRHSRCPTTASAVVHNGVDLETSPTEYTQLLPMRGL